MNINENREWKIFSANISYLRKKYNYSKEQMAKLLGIGESSISKIEDGECPERLNTSVVYAVYEAFKIDPATLFANRLEEYLVK